MDKGYTVFPVHNYLEKGKTVKKPTIFAWQKLTLADMPRVLPLFERHGVNAIGLPTGAVNKLLVVDLDPGADVTGKEIPPTPIVKTGRGRHLYFAYDKPQGNMVDGVAHIDIRCDGGFVVAPPSWHHLGAYEWVVGLEDETPAPAPEWVQTMLRKRAQPAKVFAFGAHEGSRNQSAASVIGHVLRNMHEDFWEDFGWHGLRAWNRRNNPPLDEEELYKIFISIASREKMHRDSYGKEYQK